MDIDEYWNMLEKLWVFLSSKTAIIVYVILLLLLIIFIEIFMIADEHRKPLIIKKGKESLKGPGRGRRPGSGLGIPNTNASGKGNVTQVVQAQPTIIKVETEATMKKEDKNEQTDESRFFMLTQIDEKYKDYVAPHYVNKIGLEEFCNQFRNFMSYKLKLYYNIADIRRFVASLSVSKTMILQGMSGTGKTSLAYAFGEFLQNPTTVVPIQPMWKERTDLIGYYNEFTKKFNEGVLLQ